MYGYNMDKCSYGLKGNLYKRWYYFQGGSRYPRAELVKYLLHLLRFLMKIWMNFYMFYTFEATTALLTDKSEISQNTVEYYLLIFSSV